MTLVGEADFQRDLRRWLATAKQGARAGQAEVRLILMRRQAHRACEHAQQMKVAEAGGFGQLLERHLFGKSVVQDLAGAAHGAELVVGPRR